MALSSVVAVAGIGIAWFFFLADPRRSESVAHSFSGLRTMLLNKYYVDEAYDAAIVQPIRVTSEAGLWKIVDAGAIDGLVNGTAESVGGLGELLRRLQTGSVRAYAASLLLGAVVVFGYYLWR
jgi:NADH-quinone oxidoreductase subunit L